MVFETQIRRQRWIQFCVYVLVDVAIAWGITRFMNEELFVGVAIFLGLQALGLVYMCLRPLADWAYYAAVGKRLGVATYETMLSQLQLPAARTQESSPIAYLDGISADSTLSNQTRINAAVLSGWLAGIKACQGMWANIRIDSMLETAIAGHSRNAPQRIVDRIDEEDEL